MPKLPISLSPTLTAAVHRMRGTANIGLVGIVLRFNESDATIRELWSESTGSPANVVNPPSGDREQVYRYNDDNDIARGERPANKVADATGYHAEEILIIAWAALLRDAGLREDQLTHVDIILSKSPCHGVGGTSKLRLHAAAEYLPVGCASKLVEFIRAKSRAIQWHIAFLSLAGSDAASYVPAGGAGVDSIMNTRERELAAAAARQVDYIHNVQPGLERRAAELRTSAQAENTRAATLIDRAKGEAIGAAKKHAKAAQKITTDIRESRTRLYNEARTRSINQAQHGISLLETLINVDIRRWIG